MIRLSWPKKDSPCGLLLDASGHQATLSSPFWPHGKWLTSDSDCAATWGGANIGGLGALTPFMPGMLKGSFSTPTQVT